MGRRGPQTDWAVDHNREPVVGLIERKDGRFYAVGKDGKHKTFGRDRTEAIRRFRQWEPTKHPKVTIPGRTQTYHLPADKQRFLENHPPLKAVAENRIGRFDVPDAGYKVDAGQFWNRVRSELLNDPKGAAQRTGIPELADLAKLADRFRNSATLASLRDLYTNDKKPPILTPDEWNNSRTWFDEFAAITEARTVADLTHDKVRHYRETIKAAQGKRSNSWVRSRFGKITTIINYALSEMNLIESDRTTLALKALLKKPPRPKGKTIEIQPKELKAILKHAGEFDSAMILTAANLCFYPVDIVRLRWDMLDLKAQTMSFDREKSEHMASSAVVRVGVLWDRTVRALKKLPQTSEFVFPSPMGNWKMESQTPQKHFAKLVNQAGIKRPLPFSCLRDTGQTAAAQAGVPQQQYQCLAGHKFPGVDDDYIRRNPMFVKDACAAIEKHYFG